MTFKLGPGPLLRTCAEGEKQHVQMRASGVSVEVYFEHEINSFANCVWWVGWCVKSLENLLKVWEKPS